MIERCLTVEQDGWLSLREALWPGCTAENEPSHAMHRSLGFSEMERVVFFRKAL